MLLPGDNVLLRIQLVPNVFSMLEGLQVLLVRVGLQGLFLVDRIRDCRLTLEDFLHGIFMTLLRNVFCRDSC